MTFNELLEEIELTKEQIQKPKLPLVRKGLNIQKEIPRITKKYKEMSSLSNKFNQKLRRIFHPYFLKKVYRKLPKQIKIKKPESGYIAYVEASGRETDKEAYKILLPHNFLPLSFKTKKSENREIYLSPKELNKSGREIIRLKKDKIIYVIIHEFLHLIESRSTAFPELGKLKLEIMKDYFLKKKIPRNLLNSTIVEEILTTIVDKRIDIIKK